MSEHPSSPETLKARDIIGIGSVVEIHFAGDPEEETVTVQIVGRHDEGNSGDAEWAIPTNEPLGQQLIGKEAGSTITFENAERKTIEVDIVAVR